jgi:hypothetical protein
MDLVVGMTIEESVKYCLSWVGSGRKQERRRKCSGSADKLCLCFALLDWKCNFGHRLQLAD